MNGLLLDSQLLVWVGYAPQRLGSSLAAERVDRRHVIGFSVVSLWELAIKASLGREDVQVNPAALRLGLLEQGFLEVPIQTYQVLAEPHLPRIHRDPFERLLPAQAAVERLTVLTAELTLLGYGEGVRWVGG